MAPPEPGGGGGGPTTNNGNGNSNIIIGNGRSRPSRSSPTKSNELPRRLLERDYEAAQAAVQAGNDPALSQVVSLSLAVAPDSEGADASPSLFHWRVEMKGGRGTIFEGT